MTTNADDRIGGPKRLSSAFRHVDPDTKATLDAMSRVHAYHAGQTVVGEDESMGFVGCVTSGVLRMQKTLPDGRQHIVGLLVEGDMFGRIFDGSGEFSIEAATDVEFRAFPRAGFEQLVMRSPDLERVVLLNMLNELDRARDWMIILSNQKIASRIAGFLLLMRSRLSGIDHLVEDARDGTEVRIPISREDLANLLGTRPESISRAFHALQDEGDIRIVEPNRILVRDFTALAGRVGEDGIGGLPSLKDLLQERRLKP